MAARIQAPAEAKRGDVVEVRILIQHPMETGYRVDETGKNIPRNVIRSFVCRYGGAEVLNADLSSGISANPYLQFPLLVTASGTIECEWVDDAGQRDSVQQSIRVVG